MSHKGIDNSPRSQTTHPENQAFVPSRGHSLYTEKKERNFSFHSCLHVQLCFPNFFLAAVILDIVGQTEFFVPSFFLTGLSLNDLQQIQKIVPFYRPPFNHHFFQTSWCKCLKNIFPSMTFSKWLGVGCEELICFIVLSK